MKDGDKLSPPSGKGYEKSSVANALKKTKDKKDIFATPICENT